MQGRVNRIQHSDSSGIRPDLSHDAGLGALVIGAASAALCYVFTTRLKRRFGCDDSLDDFGVYGVSGFIRTILSGIFPAEMFGESKWCRKLQHFGKSMDAIFERIIGRDLYDHCNDQNS